MQYLKNLLSLINKIKRQENKPEDIQIYAQACKVEKEIKKLKRLISLRRN